MALFKFMGLGHTRCRVSAYSGDSVKVVSGEVVEVALGSHPELTEAYFERGGFVRVAELDAESPEAKAADVPESEAVETVAEPEAESEEKSKKSKKSKKKAE
jgi:hypothetical protein